MRLDIKKIKKELKRRKWSIEDFSLVLKCKRTLPYYFLKPGQSHTFITIERIAKALDFEAKDLLL